MNPKSLARNWYVYLIGLVYFILLLLIALPGQTINIKGQEYGIDQVNRTLFNRTFDLPLGYRLRSYYRYQLSYQGEGYSQYVRTLRQRLNSDQVALSGYTIRTDKDSPNTLDLELSNNEIESNTEDLVVQNGLAKVVISGKTLNEVSEDDQLYFYLSSNYEDTGLSNQDFSQVSIRRLNDSNGTTESEESEIEEQDDNLVLAINIGRTKFSEINWEGYVDRILALDLDGMIYPVGLIDSEFANQTNPTINLRLIFTDPAYQSSLISILKSQPFTGEVEILNSWEIPLDDSRVVLYAISFFAISIVLLIILFVLKLKIVWVDLVLRIGWWLLAIIAVLKLFGITLSIMSVALLLVLYIKNLYIIIRSLYGLKKKENLRYKEVIQEKLKPVINKDMVISIFILFATFFLGSSFRLIGVIAFVTCLMAYLHLIWLDKIIE